MKLNFKKISAIASTVLLAGMSMGFASAANLGNTFVPNGVADAAIVYGSNAVQTDHAAAGNIAAELGKYVKSTGATTVTGGDVFALKGNNDNLNLGDGFQSVLSNGRLDSEDLTTLLSDGKYKDSKYKKHDFSQKIYLANSTFSLINSEDYDNNNPTLGIDIPADGPVMSYNITYDDEVNMSLMKNTDLEILGKNYYVTEATPSEIDLLDSASSQTIYEGTPETVTVNGKTYTVSVQVLGGSASGDKARFTVNDEVLDKLSVGETIQLSDGAYIVAKSIDYDAKAGSVNSAEFAIGQGQIVLKNGQNVEVNDDSIDGLSANIKSDGADMLSELSFQWNAKDDTYLTGADGYSEITMPVFKSVKLIMGGFNFPNESENTELKASSKYITLNTEVEKGSLSLPILYKTNSDDSNFAGIGKSSKYRLVTAGTDGNAFNVSLNKSERSEFVATYIEGKTAYTYVYKLSNTDVSNGKTAIDLTGVSGESDFSLSDIGKEKSKGSITFTFVGNESANNETIQVSANGKGKVYGDRIATKKGLQIMLPTMDKIAYTNVTGTYYNVTSFPMTFTEADKYGYFALADNNITATINADNKDGIDVSSTIISTTMQEIADTSKYVGYSKSDLATKVSMDESGNTNTFDLDYYGQEVSADVSVASAKAVVSNEAATGFLPVTDSEIANVKDKNLIIVGGSCINSAAATVLGGKYCGTEFTSKTGVGPGEFLIKGVQDAFTTGKLALVVAGYEATDTAMAATYLTKKDVNLTASNVYTTATSVDLVTKKA